MSHDFIIVGAGHNALAAGVMLAKSGASVLMLEAQPQPGGAIRTAEVTLPEFRHDLYATNLNAFVGSAFARHFAGDLARHGLEFVRADNAFCSLFPDGDLLGVTTSRAANLADVARLSPHDADAWERLLSDFKRLGPAIFKLLQSPIPSRALLSLPPGVLRLALQSSGGFVRNHFEHPKMQALCAAWGMHLDFPPHVRGGAVYPYLQMMTVPDQGLKVGKGGAGIMIDAMVGLFREYGGELRCATPVTEILQERGTAVGVVAGGERHAARRGVIANVTPTVLQRLVGRRLGRRPYRYGPGTMMIHLALADLPAWRNERARDFLYIHLAPTLAGMSETYRAAIAGRMPDEPTLIVGQPTVVDPTRAPAGRHVLWVQVRMVPAAVEKERAADQIIAQLERYAPGLRALILGQAVLSPADLERDNANLVGGDSVAGSHRLSQQFIFRPHLGWSRHATPIDRLFVCGAATWPGAGVGAGSGWLLGNRLLAEVQ